jgi:hypothetical protein
MPAKKISTIISRSLVMLFMSVIPAALFAQKDLPITVESGIVPPAFNMNNDTLIIAATGNPFYSISMKKHFKKNYTGAFMIVKNIGELQLTIAVMFFMKEQAVFRPVVIPGYRGIQPVTK